MPRDVGEMNLSAIVRCIACLICTYLLLLLPYVYCLLYMCAAYIQRLLHTCISIDVPTPTTLMAIVCPGSMAPFLTQMVLSMHTHVNAVNETGQSKATMRSEERRVGK